MKQTLIILLTLTLFACNQKTENTHVLQNRIDSLEKNLADTYKPGFGEFMSSIQTHHAKLWFAGQNENWKLADFEVREIIEAVENIQKYQTERKESKEISVINPVLNDVSNAIQQKNPAMFKNSFISLTNACNNCHRAVDFEFNVVKIPDVESFSNQDFKVHK
ncbi:MAG: hypothetical protein ABI723_09795 [Bacteroidia bacterium]